MIQADLAAARAAWIEEAKPEERLERERSSRLKYKDERGRFFDFHALRGQFVSNLARAGVHPKLAQQLARHSTINLTMGSYTHLDTTDLAGALDALPILNRVTKTDAKIGTKIGTSADDIGGQDLPLPAIMGEWEKSGQETLNPLQDKGFSNDCHRLSERRARESNPQPLARHLISSQNTCFCKPLHANGLRTSMRSACTAACPRIGTNWRPLSYRHRSGVPLRRNPVS